MPDDLQFLRSCRAEPDRLAKRLQFVNLFVTEDYYISRFQNQNVQRGLRNDALRDYCAGAIDEHDQLIAEAQYGCAAQNIKDGGRQGVSATKSLKEWTHVLHTIACHRFSYGFDPNVS